MFKPLTGVFSKFDIRKMQEVVQSIEDNDNILTNSSLKARNFTDTNVIMRFPSSSRDINFDPFVIDNFEEPLQQEKEKEHENGVEAALQSVSFSKNTGVLRSSKAYPSSSHPIIDSKRATRTINAGS
ncbi:hypothetical protein P9112_009017 [Eukaryota sp. TZLM1-RC]